MYYRKRIDRDYDGITFTDELHSNVGSGAFSLSELSDNDIENVMGHDYFTKEDLIIRTASGGSGIVLIENIDYTLSELNNYLTNKITTVLGTTKTIYKKIQITNASYQTGNLYISGKYIGDDLDVQDINRITNVIKTISSNTIIPEDCGYLTYFCDTNLTLTLPDAEANKNVIIGVIPDNGIDVDLDAAGSDTIEGETSITLTGDSNLIEKIKVISDGTIWRKLKPSTNYHNTI